MSVKIKRIVSVEEYQKSDGTTGKSYGPVGILKEITMDDGRRFFKVKLNQNPGVEYSVYDIEDKNKQNDTQPPGPPLNESKPQQEEDDLPF